MNDKKNREPMVIALATGKGGSMKTTSAVFLACALVDQSRGEQHVLVGLGHRTVRCSDYQDGTVHLGGTRNHVLHIVGVTRAVHVSIVAVSRLVLNVRSVDRDTTLFLLGSVVDGVERAELRQTFLCQNGRDCSGKGGLTVVNVSDGTDVHMRFRTVEFFFCHSIKYLKYC